MGPELVRKLPKWAQTLLTLIERAGKGHTPPPEPRPRKARRGDG